MDKLEKAKQAAIDAACLIYENDDSDKSFSSLCSRIFDAGVAYQGDVLKYFVEVVVEEEAENLHKDYLLSPLMYREAMRKALLRIQNDPSVMYQQDGGEGE